MWGPLRVPHTLGSDTVMHREEMIRNRDSGDYPRRTKALDGSEGKADKGRAGEVSTTSDPALINQPVAGEAGLNTEEIRNYCRARNWQPSVGRKGTLDRPRYVPVWGETAQERLASWFDITEAYTSGGGATWLTQYQGIKIPRGMDGEEYIMQLVINLGGVEVGRRENGTRIIENLLCIGCVQCEGWFKLQVPWRVPNIPDRCAKCAPAMDPGEMSELASDKPRKGKASPIRDATVEAVEHFRGQAETILLQDVVARAVERIRWSGKGRDQRAGNVRRELKKLKDIRIDGDIVILD